MKGKMDGDALKNTIINHVEKIVLALVLVIFGLLVFLGLSIEPFDDARNPDNLKSKANTVLTSLESDNWEQIKDEPEREFVAKYEKKAGDGRDPMDPGLYFDPFGEPKSRSRVKRRDPNVNDPQFAPQDIRVDGYLAAITLKGAAGVKNPYDDLENADKIEVEVEAPKRPTRNRTRPARGPRGMGSESSMMEMTDMTGMPGSSGEESLMGSSSEMGGMSGMSGYGTSMGRMLEPKYDHGFGGASGASAMYGGGGSEMMGMESSGQVAGTAKPFPYAFHFIAGTAVMPNQALSDEFDAALADAPGHLIARDRPRYITFRVIRADVTGRDVKDLEEPDDDKIKVGKGDWLNTTNNTFMNNSYVRYWGGMGPEVIPTMFRDPVLTIPVAPMLLQDNRGFLTHPAITAWIEEQQALAKKKRMVVEPELPTGGPEAGSHIGIEALSDRNKRPGGAMTSGGMESSSMMGNEMGSSEMGMESYPADSSMMMSSSEMGMGMGSEMGMGNEMGMGSTLVVASEYKLIRFYDFRATAKQNPNAPKPGRKYVYRIQVAVEDPNYPLDQRYAPALKTLDSDALTRVQQRAIDDQPLSQKYGRAYRTGYVWSAWSPPSPPVSLPETQWIATGGVEQGTNYTYGNKTFPKTPSSVSVVAGDWDWPLATYKTAAFDKATVGTILNNFKFEDEIIDPLSKVVKKLESAKVATNDVLLDIGGGESMAVKDDEDADPLPAPAKLLVFGPDGGLRVHHEVRDAYNYRMYTFADERERAIQAKTTTSAASEMMDSSSMMEGAGIFGE